MLIHCIDDGRIPTNDVLYGQLTTGVRNVGCPTLRFKEASKHDLKACEIYPNNWKEGACDRACWRRTVKEGIERIDVKRHQKAEQCDCRKTAPPRCSARPRLAHLHTEPHKMLQHHQRLTREHELSLETSPAYDDYYYYYYYKCDDAI